VGLVVPVLLIWTMPSNHMIGLFVILLHLIGVAAIRWLFFAEARHVQALYYGR
jgi:DMSO reductase anchor subunit